MSAPLFESSMLRYAGAFRLPRTQSNGQWFSFGGGPIAVDPVSNTLFAGNRESRVTEVSIPDLVDGPIAALNWAEYLQPFTDPFNGKLVQVDPTGYDESLLGMLYTPEGDLILTGGIYYDSGGVQRVSHFKRPRDLRATTDSGWHPVWNVKQQGMVAGMMLANVPPSLRSVFGGPTLTGQTGLPIITRGSYGPAAFAFDHTALAADDGALVPATPLLYYDGSHPTLGLFSPPEGAPNEVWNGTMFGFGSAVIEGIGSMLVFGRIGIGRFDYGPGTTDPNLAKPQQQGMVVSDAPSEHYCYDPDMSDKGQHAWPYRFQIWAYDIAQLEDVREGIINPWDVRPTIFPLTLPYYDRNWRLSGVTYDPTRKRLYVGQSRVDTDGYSSRAIIHAFDVLVPVVQEPTEPPVDPTKPEFDAGGRMSDATLLDYFAASVIAEASQNTDTFEKMAAFAYDAAQAMVKEKRRREQR